MLERNMKIKNCAENFFEKSFHHDLVITAEEKCFVSIYEKKIKNNGDSKTYLVNFDIKDTISDASSGALEIKDFVDMCMKNVGSLELRIMTALEEFNKKYSKNNIFTILDE